MTTVILSIIVVLMSAGGLAIGLLFGRGPIKGTCGGLACGSGTDCNSCPRNH